MKAYRIEQNQRREDSLHGEKPLEVQWASSLTEASKRMEELADDGLYYAAVFLKDTGECVMETKCPMGGSEG